MLKNREYFYQFKFDKKKNDYVIDKIFYRNQNNKRYYVKSANGYTIGDLMPTEFQVQGEGWMLHMLKKNIYIDYSQFELICWDTDGQGMNIGIDLSEEQAKQICKIIGLVGFVKENGENKIVYKKIHE